MTQKKTPGSTRRKSIGNRHERTANETRGGTGEKITTRTKRGRGWKSLESEGKKQRRAVRAF